MWDTLKLYLSMLKGYRTQALSISALWALAGLMESAALLSLSPILYLGFNGVLPPAVRDFLSAHAPWVLEWLANGESFFIVSVILFFVFVCISQIGVMVAEALVVGLGAKLEDLSRKRMAEATTRLSWSFYHSQRLGDLSKSLIKEGFYFGLGVQTLLQAIGYLTVVLTLMTAAALIAPTMTLLAVAFVTVFGFLYKGVVRRIQQVSSKLSELDGRVSVYGTEIFSNLKFWKSSGTTSIILKELFKTTELHKRQMLLTSVVRYFGKSLFQIVGAFFVSALLVVVYLKAREHFTNVLIFLGLFYRVAPKLQAFQISFLAAVESKSFVLSLKKRQELFRQHEEKKFGIQQPSFDHTIQFKNLCFSYSPAKDVFQLQDINLTLKKGTFTAVVGPSGSGKSTLFDIITGLLSPTKGSVLLDGTDLREVDIEAWRRRIGLVLQETPLFHSSVLENITWQDQVADFEKARQCAQLANAWEFIEKLPQGLNTVVGERGGMLSGGQKQRIALARALYRDPWLLILDEPTSALDSKSEKQIQDVLLRLKGTLTILIVTHRLTPIEHADQIVVLEAGRIVKSGVWGDVKEKLLPTAPTPAMAA